MLQYKTPLSAKTEVRVPFSSRPLLRVFRHGERRAMPQARRQPQQPITLLPSPPGLPRPLNRRQSPIALIPSIDS